MWYGIWYWIVGAILTLVQFLGTVHPVVSQIIFYGFVLLVPVLFAYPFFARMLGTPTWVMGVRLAVSWIVLFTVLDGLIFLWWLEFPLQVYLSWQLAFAYVVLLILCMGIAAFIGRMNRSQGPEGLV